MDGPLSALCQGWDRPGTRPTVTENGSCVTYARRLPRSTVRRGWTSRIAVDADCIVDAFSILPPTNKARYSEYRTKKVILEMYGATTQAMATGEPYQTILEPLPAAPGVRAKVTHQRVVIDRV